MNTIHMKAGGKSAEVLIYDQIGSSWFADGVTAKSFMQALSDVGQVDSIDVRINSPGGLVFEGNAIYNALKNHPAKVNVHIDGIAASIASIIAMAGDTITMAENAAFMIHEPWSGVVGNADDMRKEAETLGKLTDISAKAYADRTGQPETAIRAAMKAETWYTASEALAAGFVDKISPNKQIVACASLHAAKFSRVPDWVSRSYTPCEPKAEPVAQVKEARPSPPMETPMANETAPQADPKAARGEFANQLKRYREAFGDKDGADWLMAGLDWSEAVEMHNDTLKKQLASKDEEIRKLNERLASLDDSEKAPASFSEAPAPGDKPKKQVHQWGRSLGESLAALQNNTN